MNGTRSKVADRILEAALRLFAEKGYERTTIPDIQTAVGLSPRSGALYKHFPSKESLLTAIVDRYINAAKSTQSAFAALDLPPREGLALIGRSMFRLMADRSNELTIVWRDLEQFPELQERVRERVMQANCHRLTTWLDYHSREGNLEINDSGATAAILLGSLGMFRAFEGFWGDRIVNVSDEEFLGVWQDFAEKALGLKSVSPPDGKRLVMPQGPLLLAKR
jgi:AcrR family transcriptional regulator